MNSQNPIENALIGLWISALGSQNVDVTSNFLDDGCDQVIIDRFQDSVERIFQIGLQKDWLRRYPTIRQLAHAVADERLRQKKGLPPIIHVPRDQPIPLSFSQERMWFVQQLEKHSTAYNVGGAAGFQGRLDRDALQKSLNAVVRRHEMLRTVFPVVDGRPVQSIRSVQEQTIDWIDLTGFPEDRRRGEGMKLAEECTRITFDLEHGPLFFLRVIKLAEEEHILAINLHHIIVDAWAMGVLCNELAAFYNAYAKGQEKDIPELSYQYADYVVWQRQLLSGDRFDRQITYWRQKLHDLSPVELPSLRSRPAVQTYVGSALNVHIPEDLMESIEQYCQEENVTPFMAFLAAFYLLLYRYTNQTDLTLAVPIANRNWTATQDIIGTLVNTLLMRVQFSGEMTFRQLLHTVRNTALEAYDYQDMPYSSLVAELQPDRDASRTPLAQIMFNMVNVPFEMPHFDHLEIQRLETDRLGVQFDLTFNIHQLADERKISLEFNTDLFDRADMERLAVHYQHLMEKVITDSDLPLGRLDMLTTEEHRQLDRWNATGYPYPEDANVLQLFEEQASSTPETPAFLCGGVILTYAELNYRANQMAWYLKMKGATPGMVIGLCASRSIDAVIALLGILKAGGVYLPLDPAYPLSRLEYMLQDSGARVIIGQSAYVEPLAGYCDWTICLDHEAGIIATQNEVNLPAQLVAQSPLYILYTSGSTGKPKGVVGSHRAALNRFAWMWRVFPFGPGEVACQKTALSFVDSVWELFGPLLCGIPTVIIPDEISKDPTLLVEELSVRGVTRIVMVPSLLKAILELQPSIQRKLSALRFWVSSGEVLPVGLAKQFSQVFPDALLINLYGSSEVAGDVTWYDTREIVDSLPAIPIGRPIDNTTMYVLDADLNPMPVGIPGDIYAGGVNLALGYHNNPELTAQMFVPDPFSKRPGARLYRTGDQGYFLPDGNLLYLGRKDHQVKLRGMRIELDEIEQAISQIPGVTECVVTVMSLEPIGQILPAYVVKQAGAMVTLEELREQLRRRLPEYMIPDRFVFLKSLPRTPNGKLDRKALPIPDAAQRAISISAPAGDMLEQQIAAVWEEVLNVHPVSPEDSFFDMGGHSLLAIRLLARMQEKLGIRIPVMLLFQLPTVSGIAQSIRAGASEIVWQTMVPIHAHGSHPPFFLVHGFGGSVTGYTNLARCLGPDQPLYGLQAAGLDGKTPPQNSVPEMAARYIHALQAEIQPKGPYFLGGYCFGGLVAYEMARQLEARGEKVAFLALLETYPTRRMDRPWRVLAPRNFLRFLRNSVAWLAGEKARRRRQKERLKRWVKEPAISTRHSEDHLLARDDVDPSSLIYPGFFQVGTAHLQAINTYLPGHYSGPVDIFRVRTFRLSSPLDDDLGWKRFVNGKLCVHQIPGGHDNMLELPLVEALAVEIKACLCYGTKKSAAKEADLDHFRGH